MEPAAPADLAAALDRAQQAGRTAVAVTWDGRPRGVLSVADTVKDQQRAGRPRLRALGLTPVLLTGDHAAVAAAVAREVGIDPEQVHAEVLPQDKVAVVPGPAGAAAGSSRWSATASTTPRRSPRPTSACRWAPAATSPSRPATSPSSAATCGSPPTPSGWPGARSRTIRGNLFWAFGYNVAALPLAAAGLLNPMIAGAAMAFSSVFVVTNSLRLRGFRPLSGR